MIAKPGEKRKVKHWKKSCHKSQSQTQCSHQKWHHRPMCESACAHVIFVAFWPSCSDVFVWAAKWFWVNSKLRQRSDAGLAGPATLNDKWFQSHTFTFGSWVCWFLTNITWNGLSCGVAARDTFKVFRKKTSFSLVCMNVLHHVDKKALCSMSVLKLGCMSTSNSVPVFTAVIKLSAFVDAFVRQSDWQFWVELRARSWMLPEQSSFLNIEIMWIVSFCSGKWIVLAVVTRFFASVLMWIFAISPDRSIHNPRRTDMNQNTSWRSTAQSQQWRARSFKIFWLSKSIRLPYDIPSFAYRSRDSAKKRCHASLKIHLHCFDKRHQEIQLSSTVPWVARTEVWPVVT